MTETPCNCGHEKDAHFRGEGECMFSTESETWACGCHEYQLALMDGGEVPE